MTAPYKIMTMTTAGSYGYSTTVQFRVAGDEWQRKVSTDLSDSMYGTPAEVIARIQEASEGLLDTEIDMDVDYGSYGDRDRDRVMLTGWRADVTEEEKTETLRQERVAREEQAERSRAYAMRNMQSRAAAEETLAAIRQQHPDLLK